MSLPSSEPILPANDKDLPPARRRRQRRSVLPPAGDERTQFLMGLAHQITPAFDYFLNAGLFAVVLAAAIIVDSPAFYLLAVLLAPFQGPVLGLSMAVVVGSARFLLNSLGSLVIAGLAIFGGGAAAGWISQGLELKSPARVAHWFSFFSWPSFVLLAVGSGLAMYMLVRAPRQKPLVANVAIVFGLFLPLSVAGFGLAGGIDGLWVDGLIVFLVHLAWTVIVGSVVLFIMGLRPSGLLGYTLATTFGLLGIFALVVVLGIGTAFQAQVGLPPTRTPTSTGTPTLPATLAPSPTPQPTQPSSTPTPSLVPSQTPTQTITPQPTPVWARVNAPTGGGAFIREEPDGKILSSLLNGSVIAVISEPVRGQGGTIWVQVRTENGITGWMVQALLATATPSPGW